MNIADFHFHRPLWLLSLIPYGIIVFLLLRSKLSHNVWSAVCDAELLPYLLREKTGKQQQHGQLFTGALAALLTIIALAGPTWQRLPSPVFRNASALVIALDLSSSMDAADIKPSRLIRARYKIADILKQRKDGQSALVVYAGDAFTVTPLTDDIDTIINQLNALTTDIVPSQGNDTRLALEKSVALFKQAGLQNGDIILVTDGVDDKSRAYVSDIAANYRLSILGVGTADGAPIALPEGGFLKDEQGAIVMPKLNANELAGLAQTGNGVYQSIASDDSDVQALLAQVDSRLNNTQSENKSDTTIEQWDDKGAWLLLLVLPLAALSFRKGVLCFALLLLIPLPKNSYAFEWQDLWQNKNQQAQHAYSQKQFDQAAEKFDNPEWKAAAHYKAKQYEQAAQALDSRIKSGEASDDDYYNQGNALAQTGKLAEAVKFYEQSLQRNPNNADAKYNKELVEKELKKQQQQQEQKNQQQQNDKQQQDDQQKNSQNEQKDQQNSQEKQANDEKSEQQPEQSKEKNADDIKNQQQEKSEAEKGKEEKAKKEEEVKQAKQQQVQEDKKPAQPETKPTASEQEKPSDEQQQANEQWLKRIPDDPAGLLRRKFQRQHDLREE